MPIYAYKCDSCGHAADVLQKMSDAPLTECPECGASTFRKQLTAAGFQLKGSGWYATDFRNSGTGSKKPESAGESKPEGGDATAAGEKGGGAPGDKKDAPSTTAGEAAAAKPAPSTPAPAPGGAAAG